MRTSLLLILCAACGGGASSSPDAAGTPDAAPFSVTQPTKLATTTYQAHDLVADADAVYWIGGTLQPPLAYELHRVDLRTGADTTLASSTTTTASQLAMDDTSIYWADTDTYTVSIHAVAKAGGTPRTLESNVPYSTSVAAGGGRIYWVDANGGARSASAADGSDVVHLDDVAGQAFEIDVDPARQRVLFIGAGPGVWAIPEAGGARTKIGDAIEGDLAIGDTRLAYTVWQNGGLVVADLDGKNAQPYEAGASEARVAMIGDTIYWNDLATKTGQSSLVHRLEPGTTQPVTVATATGGSIGLAVTAGAIFYGDGNAIWAAPR
jgi:hypothetical protein